jgi:trans-aconitate methyltransferase
MMAHEFDGGKYEKASTHQKEWGAKLISELMLKGDERVLDLGCGAGDGAALIAQALPKGEVVGIDASQGMIDTAKPKEGAKLRFLLMDIEKMTFEDEFDVIYSNATLHWIKDHHRLLRNAHKALRVGGFLRFNFAADGNCSHFYRVIRGAMEKEEFSRFFSDFSWPWYMPTIDEYAQLVGESAFTSAKVWGENADRFFPDTEAMLGWVDQPSIVPFLARIPESRKADFREYVFGEMIRETRQTDGKCFETFRRVNLFAEKSIAEASRGLDSRGRRPATQ